MRDGSAIAAASAVGRSPGSTSTGARAGAGGRSSASASAGGRGRARGGTRHGIEVERQLQPAALRWRRDRPCRAPAGRARGTGDARRRDRAVGRHAPQRLGGVARRLAGHRRQALDQRAELVLAEQPDDRLAVVVAEPRRLEVELDRQVAHDRREVLAHEHLLAMLDELLAELVGLDLVDALVERVERPVLADQLRRGLLADAGDARDVVGRVALERLVVDHLARHEVEPLADLRSGRRGSCSRPRIASSSGACGR